MSERPSGSPPDRTERRELRRHADLLYKLAGQAVQRVQSYLRDPNDVQKVIQYHSIQMARLIYAEWCGTKWPA